MTIPTPTGAFIDPWPHGLPTTPDPFQMPPIFQPKIPQVPLQPERSDSRHLFDLSQRAERAERAVTEALEQVATAQAQARVAQAKADALALALGKAGAVVALLCDVLVTLPWFLITSRFRDRIRAAFLDAGLDPVTVGLS